MKIMKNNWRFIGLSDLSKSTTFSRAFVLKIRELWAHERSIIISYYPKDSPNIYPDYVRYYIEIPHL